MKLFEAYQIAEIDHSTIVSGIQALELMDRAAVQFVKFLKNKILKTHSILCICGKGNNGGDGLLIAEKLLLEGHHVYIVVADIARSSSSAFDFHYQRISSIYPSYISRISDVKETSFKSFDIIIDALFGNGLNRPLSSEFREIIQLINNSGAKIISVDIASGLYKTMGAGDIAVRPSYSFSFEFPKLEFLLSDYPEYVGSWDIGSIGLRTDQIEEIQSPYNFVTQCEIADKIKKRNPWSHKGNFGTSLIVAGSTGMAGAGILCAQAALRTGIGICKLVADTQTKIIYQNNVKEALALDYEEFDVQKGKIDWKKLTVAIGPGLGMSNKSKEIFQTILDHLQSPCIMDADAINLLAESPDLLKQVPKFSILTPHVKEFSRLFGYCNTDLERMEVQIGASISLKIFIILKGKYSRITTPDGDVYFNSSGNPGMATGGSGDVLTGILVALLAQQYSPLDTALVGTFIHGMAGDIAAKNKSEMSLVAGDIIDYLSDSFLSLNNSL